MSADADMDDTIRPVDEEAESGKQSTSDDTRQKAEEMNIEEDGIKAQTQPESDVPRPRLVIHSLVLENFKSYGGSVKIGPFHKRFSSIVGPNGSGKSNVIDAMLFVFGRRAKQLRHSKMSELLHHSETHPDVTSGTVTVHFREIIDSGDGDEEYDVVEGSDFAVARRAFKNNTSKYYLNGKETQMKHVITLLKSKGVDLDNNRFLILQGEVEQIAMMKPKAVNQHEDGLLEYLEDIIGTNKYVPEIGELATQVETLNEERTHKLNRVKAVQKERDALEGAKNEAENFLEKEREFYGKKGTFIKSKIAEQSLELRGQNEVLTEAKSQLEESQKLFQEREKNVEEFHNKFEDAKAHAEQLGETLNAARNEYQKFERRDITLRENLKALKTKTKKLTNSVEKEAQKKQNAEEDLETHEGEVADAEKLVKKLETKLRKAEAELEKVHHDVRETTAPIRARLEQKQKELLPHTDRINRSTQELEVAKTELKLLVEKRDAPERELAQQKTSLDSMRGELEKAESEVSELKNKDKEVKHGLQELGGTIAELEKEYAEISERQRDLQRKVAEAQQSSHDNSSRNRVQDGLHRAMREGRLVGVVGRLADLASVEKRYDIAVGAAAGARLDNIVVTTAESAQSCIHLLRRENLGRATFVILDKIQHLQRDMDGWSNNEHSKDGPRLFDYLSVKRPEHRVALYHALGNTLVAEGLDDARRMAFKPTRKNKVVTVSGELIEASGAMSGGGRGPPRHRLGKGGNSFEVDPRALQKAKDNLEKVQNAISEVEKELDRAKGERNGLALREEDIESRMRRADIDVQSLRARVNDFIKRIPELRKAVDAAKKAQRGSEGKKVQAMEKRIKDCEHEADEANKACEDIQEAISNMQKEIVAAGGKPLEKAKAAVDQTRTELSGEKSKASKAASRAKEATKTAKKAEKAIEKLTKELEGSAKEREEFIEEKKGLEGRAAKLVNTHEDAKQKHDEALKDQEKAQQEHSEVREALKAQRREEVVLKERVAGAKRNVKACQIQMKDLKRELAKIEANVKRINDVFAGISCEEAEGDGEGENEEMEVEEENPDDDDNEDKMDVDEDEEGDDAEDEEGDDEGSEDEDDGILSPAERSRLATEISTLQSFIADKSTDLRAISEYRKKEQECKSHEEELNTVTEARDKVRKDHDKLCKRRHDEFKTGFDEICKKLKELYQMITLGGDAELEFVDSMYPFTEGIVFSVRPPKKSWKNISNLSGGEKTLSSLALVFALHYYKPTPLYFLDEIDAALDFKNVSIVANYVKERTKDAQFIIISLRNNMFELADRLVGIYKTNHSTKSVTVNPKAFVVA